jgi:hypothetical protein
MQPPSKPLVCLLEVLDRLEIPYQIEGSVASSAHGIPRTTLDVDLVVDMAPELIDDFASALSLDFSADSDLQSDEYSRAACARRSFREIRPDAGEAIKCAVASARRIRSRITIQDTILRQLEWSRAGGGSPDRQRNDLPGHLLAESAL